MADGKLLQCEIINRPDGTAGPGVVFAAVLESYSFVPRTLGETVFFQIIGYGKDGTRYTLTGLHPTEDAALFVITEAIGPDRAFNPSPAGSGDWAPSPMPPASFSGSSSASVGQ
ncbi:hypothetical protein [Parafrankia discariae]|uniref:hypothetical protein n=1 Tax=Parafrankia discariae TaxID=365528 RepID=UPI0003A6EB83|nr:hypothetical protein [Parafrankia discariae]